jgi:hypothetical protein
MDMIRASNTGKKSGTGSFNRFKGDKSIAGTDCHRACFPGEVTPRSYQAPIPLSVDAKWAQDSLARNKCSMVPILRWETSLDQEAN